MLLYDILLYKRVFDIVYLHMPYASIMQFWLFSFLFLFVFRWHEIWLLARILLFTLVPVFFLYFFFLHPASVFQSSHPNYHAMTHRQSETHIKHILWQQFLAAGALIGGQGRKSFLSSLSCKIYKTMVCLPAELKLRIVRDNMYLSVTSCTAGPLVNRHLSSEGIHWGICRTVTNCWQ